jgi:hypothetical protein
MMSGGLNGKKRQQLAELLQPWLAGMQTVGLANARDQLHHLAPDMTLEIDGIETSHILRRAGFTKDYSRPVGPSLYRRVSV